MALGGAIFPLCGDILATVIKSSSGVKKKYIIISAHSLNL